MSRDVIMTPLDSEDLAPLLTAAQGDPTALRGGTATVIAWNSETGENVIEFRGTNLTNLPMVVSSAEVLQIQPGDKVLLNIFGTGGFATVYIVGRVAQPGPGMRDLILSTVANNIVAASDLSVGTRSGSVANTYVWGDLTGSSVGPSVTVTVGNSGKALVLFSAEIGHGAPVSQGIGAWTSVDVSGATAIGPDKDWALGFNENPVNEAGIWSAGQQKLYTGLNPGTHTFTLKYAVFPVASSVSVTCDFAEREIAVFAM